MTQHVRYPLNKSSLALTLALMTGLVACGDDDSEPACKRFSPRTTWDR